MLLPTVAESFGTPSTPAAERQGPTCLRDVRYVFRSLRRAPNFAAATLLVVALGVGGTTAVFSLVYGVLLRPLPYPESDRLVAVAERRGAATTLSSLTYTAWIEDARTIEDLPRWL